MNWLISKTKQNNEFCETEPESQQTLLRPFPSSEAFYPLQDGISVLFEERERLGRGEGDDELRFPRTGKKEV